MKYFSLSFFLLLKEYRNNKFSILKQTLILIAIFSLITILFLLPESYKSMRQIPYETAKYDLRLSGAISEETYISLLNNSQVLNMVGITEFKTSVSNQKSSKKTIGSVLFVSDLEKASYLLPTNKELLVRGSFKKDEAVISAAVADTLDLDIGDQIVIDWSLFGIKNVQVVYKVSGILYESSHPRQIIVDRNTELALLSNVIQSLSNGSTVVSYTSAFLVVKQDTHINSLINADKENIIGEWREAALEAEKEEVAKLESLNFRYTKYGTLFLYLAMFTWIVISQIDKRTNFYAIMTACGSPLKMIYIHFFLDLFMLSLMVIIISTSLSSLYFKHFLHFYITRLVVIKMLTFATIVNIIWLGIASILGFRKLGKLSISEILKRE